ncbi:hypothetical protein [Virgisporangium aliadipatigenens]|uniref:hypothetical protein n=1 Tax=Virgisporangium aliadipatigenens TaxID=741659 RepID=UPI001944393E|nr:hypothetical protein [Virgisporangium aliadipatigenens]
MIDTPMLVGGAFLVLTELARSVPAWLRVRRSRSSDGVSPVSIGVLGGTVVAWFAAAVAARSPAAVVATAVWFGLHVLLWRETARVTPPKARTIAVTAAVSLVVSAAVTIGGWASGHGDAALAATIGIASVSYSLPALVSGMTSATTAGLSMAALAVNATEGAIYLVAGLGLGGITPAGRLVPAYLVFGAVTLASNAPLLVRTGSRRLRGADRPRTRVR